MNEPTSHTAPAMRHAVNQFDQPSRSFYAFVTEAEGLDEDPLYVRLECVDKFWMDNIWSELAKLFDPGAFREFFDTIINGKPFEDFYPALTADQLTLLYGIFFWFLKRVIDDGNDFAPVSTYEFVLDPGDALREGLYECDWYTLLLRDTADTQRADDDRIVKDRKFRIQGGHIEFGFTPDDDLPEVIRFMSGFELVPDTSKDGALTQGALKALHFPLPAPSEGTEGGEGPPEPGPKHIEPERASSLVPPVTLPPEIEVMRERLRGVIGKAHRWIRDAADAVRDFFDDFPPMGPRLALAGACGAALHARAPRTREVDPAKPMAYCGSPDPNPMDSNGAPWPPFVGILNIGQGGCSALYDRNGHAIVYYDFGSPANGQQGTMPILQGHDLNPCLCNGPTIILSHWDMDHCDLGRFYTESYKCRWIAPQQFMGTFTVRDTIARVVHEAGQFYVWTASGRPGGPGTLGSAGMTGGSHMRFPWGFVERCYKTGQNPLNKGADPRNNSGLVAYVCVRDATGAPIPPPPVAAAATDANGGGAAGVRAVTLGGAVGPPWIGAALGGPNLPAAGGLGGLAAVLNAAGPAAVAARANMLRANAVINAFPGNVGAAATRRQRIVATVTGLAHPIPGAAGIARVSWAAELAAEAARAAGGTIAQMAIGAAAAVRNEHAGHALAARHQAMGVAAVNGAVAAGLAGGEPGHLNAVTGPVGGAVGLAAIGAAAAVVNIIAGGGVATEAAVRAIAHEHAMLPTPAGLAPAAAVAMHFNLDAIVVGTASAEAPPQTRIGPAPFLLDAAPLVGERYVLLTGDVNYSFVPGQKHAAPPVVVGLTATHHGSIKVGASSLVQENIPWAPASVAARAAAGARAANAAGGSARQIAVAAAAQAAVGVDIHAMAIDAEDVAGQVDAGGGNANAVAIAAATAAVGGGGLPIGTLLAIINAALGAGAPGAIPLPHQNDYLAIAAAVGGAPLTPAAAANAAAITMTAVNVMGTPEVIHAAVAAVLRPQPAALVTTSARRTAKAAYSDAHPAMPQPVVVASAVAAAVAHATAINTAITQASCNNIVNGTIAAFGANPMTVPNAQGLAANHVAAAAATRIANAVVTVPAPPLNDVVDALAAANAVAPIPLLNSAHAAATALGVDTEVVIEAMVAGTNHTSALALDAVWATVAVFGPAVSIERAAAIVSASRNANTPNSADRVALLAHESKKIAYSYGVAHQTGGVVAGTPWAHRYPSGGVGHPSWTAIDKYVARGWTERRNTSFHCADSAQPDTSPMGPIALGWEIGGVYEGPLRPVNGGPAIVRPCARCDAQARNRAAGGAAAGANLVPANARAVVAPANPANAAGAGHAATSAAITAAHAMIPAQAARAGVTIAEAARRAWPRVQSATECLPVIVAADDLSRWLHAADQNLINAQTPANAVQNAVPPNLAAGMVNTVNQLIQGGVNPSAAVWVSITAHAVQATGLVGNRAAIVIAAAWRAAGSNVNDASTMANYIINGTAALATNVATDVQNALNAGRSPRDSARCGAARHAALDAGLVPPASNVTAAAMASAAGVTPLVCDAIFNTNIAASYGNAAGGPNATPRAAALAIVAQDELTVLGIIPGTPAENAAVLGAVIATAGEVRAAADGTANGMLATAVNSAADAALANAVAHRDAVAAVLAAATVAVRPQLNATQVGACAAAAATASGNLPNANVQAAAAALFPGIPGTVAQDADNAQAQMGSSPSAAAAVVGAMHCITILGAPIAQANAADRMNCVSAAATAIGVLSGEAIAAATPVAVPAAPNDVDTAVGAAASALASACVAAGIARATRLGFAHAVRRATGAAAAAVAAGAAPADAVAAAEAIAPGLPHAPKAAERAIPLTVVPLDVRPAAVALVVARVFARSHSTAVVAAAGGVPAPDAAGATTWRLFNV